MSRADVLPATAPIEAWCSIRRRLRVRLDVAGVDRLAAVVANPHRLHVVVARAVMQTRWWPVLAGEIAVAPLHERDRDRIEVEPLCGQPVLVPNGVIAVGGPFEQ